MPNESKSPHPFGHYRLDIMAYLDPASKPGSYPIMLSDRNCQKFRKNVQIIFKYSRYFWQFLQTSDRICIKKRVFYPSHTFRVIWMFPHIMTWCVVERFFNPIPTSHGWNQPIYERHVTKSGRNRVKIVHIYFCHLFQFYPSFDQQKKWALVQMTPI